MSGDKDIDIKVRIWRQKSPSDKGGLVTYDVPGVSTGYDPRSGGWPDRSRLGVITNRD